MKKTLIINKITLVIISIAISFIISELLLRLFFGRPPLLNANANFDWAYLEIHRPFFLKDKGFYTANRARYDFKFPIKKTSDEKRVFIIGESVAGFFEDRYLKERLDLVLPDYNWQVINCGIGGYDSYRTLLVAREIIRYQPDLIVVMMGNNEGNHKPIKINNWVYEYEILSRFWVTILVTNYINPSVTCDDPKTNQFFEKHLKEMIDICRSKNIPLAVCTVPTNRRISRTGNEILAFPEYFAPWWTLWHDADRAIKMFVELENKQPGMISQNFYIAQGYEEKGDIEKAVYYYKQHIDLPEDERMQMIRANTKNNPPAILVDFEKIVLDYSNKSPGFDFFIDENHYWYEIYELVSDSIIRSVYEYQQKGLLHFAKRKNWEIENMKEIDIRSLLNRERSIYIDRLYDFCGNVKPQAMSLRYAQTIEILRDLYKHVPDECHRIVEETYGPDNTVVSENFLTLFGELLWTHGRYREAIKYLDRAIEMDPKLDYAYLFRGLAYYDLGQRKAAEKDLKILVSLRADMNWLTLNYLDGLSLKN